MIWFKDFLAVIKPRPTLMAAASTQVGYLLASSRLEWGMLHTLFGAVLLGASASALNQYLEHDVDALMKRTQDRPIPQGRIARDLILAIGCLLGVSAVSYLFIFTNGLAALFGVIILFAYVGLYTPLKRKTPIALWVGAVPGALPPVLGWVAAQGVLAWECLPLFLIVFFWQFPHFMAIACLYREDYGRAGLPNLATRDPQAKILLHHMWRWSWGLVLVSLLPFWMGMSGWGYVVAALVLGSLFLNYNYRLTPATLPLMAKRYVLWSVIYLPLLFISMIWDHLI